MLDLTRPVQTRDGRKVRILCTDAKGVTAPVIGLVDNGHYEATYSWSENGTRFGYSPDGFDLINAPTKRKVWLNVYEDLVVGRYSKEAADERGERDCLACVEVEIEY